MNDLAALRWQHIRAIEHGQLQQQEILRLKDLLKQKDEQYGQSRSSFESQRAALKKIINQLKKSVFLLKSDLAITKKEFTSDITATKDEFWKLKSSTKELELRSNKRDMNADRMNVEIELLRRQISDSEGSRKLAAGAYSWHTWLSTIHLMHDMDVISLAELQNEIEQLTEELKRAVLDCSMKDMALTSVREEKDALSEKYDVTPHTTLFILHYT